MNNRHIQSPVSKTISTGSLRLDIALCTGGLPPGQITCISGSSGSGKTTLCQQIVTEAQKTGGTCAWIDCDHTFDPRYAIACGLDAANLYLAEPSNAEIALDILEMLARSGALAVIILDSIKGLVSQDEIKAEMGDFDVREANRLLAHKLHTLHQILNHLPTIVIFTNPEPMRMSQVYHRLSEHTERLALPLSAALHLRLHPYPFTSESQIKNDLRIKVEIVKNKFAPCFKSIELDIIGSRGIKKTGDLLELGQSLGIISPAPFYYYKRHLALGADYAEAEQSLNQHPWIAAEIEHAIRTRMLPSLYAKDHLV